MSKLSDAVLSSDLSAITEAIISGADVNEVDREHQMTPLLWAILRGDIDTVRLLLENGANPNLTFHPHAAPLWHAEDDWGFAEIAALLRSYGAKK